MLKSLKIIAAIIVLAIAGILIFAATRPDTLRVQRAALIKAPPEKIFPLINDLHSWASWSPYERKDPAMKRSFSGANSGAGAVYEWDGDKNVGKGRMEITQSLPASQISLKLDFVKPFEAHNLVDFSLKPHGDTTEVTWVLRGPYPYFSKLMGVFLDMDRMIGTDFEVGLANLKTVAEG